MRIMTIATGLFAEQGVRAINIDHISNNCQIKKREFYIHFESKEALISRIIAEWIGKSGRHLRMIPSLSFNAITELQSYFSFIEETLALVSPILITELETYYTTQWLRLSYFRDTELLPFIIQNVERGLSEGIYKADIDKLLLTRLYYHQVQGVYQDKFLLKEMHRMFISGVVNTKGLHFI